MKIRQYCHLLPYQTRKREAPGLRSASPRRTRGTQARAATDSREHGGGLNPYPGTADCHGWEVWADLATSSHTAAGPPAAGPDACDQRRRATTRGAGAAPRSVRAALPVKFAAGHYT